MAKTQTDSERRMADYAIGEVARRALVAAVRRFPPQWEDYPHIGAEDWERVEAEVERLTNRTDVQTEKYDAAYRHLAGRADGKAEK